MVPGRPQLGEILIRRGILTRDQLEECLSYRRERGTRLGKALADLGYCSDIEIARALAEQLEVPFVDLKETPPSASLMALLPREIAFSLSVVPVRMDFGRLLVATLDPFDVRADQAVTEATGLPVVLAAAPETQIRELLLTGYSELVEESDPEPERDECDELELSLEKLAAACEQVSTVRVVDALLADAIRAGASDLHIRPEAQCIRIRHRLDGSLRTLLTLPITLHPRLVARIKILAGMDISENRRPQDGGAQIKVKGQRYELRVSTLPGIYGEAVVIRILVQDSLLANMSTLGMSRRTEGAMRRMLAVRSGMILITGPTGSGKTTTLYAALSHLNTDEVNIITVEDPVEIKLSGVTQVQIHERAGRTFATALRSVLRQDPDVVMVGEIRDTETAEIACRAAMTGHLVLSTLHTQDSVSALSRLFDMGIQRYIAIAALEAVVAQRLVRRVCGECAEPYEPPARILRLFERHFNAPLTVRFRRGRGCPACHGTGTRGRVGVYELLEMDEEIRAMVADGASAALLRDYLRRSGRYVTMERDAFEKAARGLIPPEEILRLGMTVATSEVESEGPSGVGHATVPMGAWLPREEGGSGGLPEAEALLAGAVAS